MLLEGGIPIAGVEGRRLGERLPADLDLALFLRRALASQVLIWAYLSPVKVQSSAFSSSFGYGLSE